jgi:ribosomal protein L11 methyltransferase
LIWLEISLTLSGELAEAVSDLFNRFTANGVVIEMPHQIENDGIIDIVIIRAYLPMNDDFETRRLAIEEGLWHLSQISPLPQPQYRTLEEEDWEQAWKRHYQPIPIGKRLLIYPAWLPPPESDRIPLLIDPGMAFGTGTHPTTQLCLLALEELLMPGQVVLDLGCGSGILSIAAARLGSARVLALDIDPVAVKNTQENALRNNVVEKILAMQGSIELLVGNPNKEWPSIDLILANILAKTLEGLLPIGLADLVRPGGSIVLSGILDHQVEHLAFVCAQQGLEIVQIKALQDWRAMIAERTSPPT